ncbi:MAG: CBS domain-containing protein [Bacteroidetes bacterium]|nr:CBS domain-containing protein [Bacteroidota bacterium]
MKISASIYSSKVKSLSTLVKELDEFHVDYFHVDCNDELKVFDDIKAIRKKSKTQIDLHIISDKPEKFFPKVIENNVDLVTFQYENLKGKIKIPKEIKSKLGLAIISETEIDVFEKYKDRFDFILFMTTTPGKSGGTFNKENFKKIREFHQKYPEKKIHVDGGVTADVSFVLRNMGVYSVVSGSYLVNSSVIGSAMHNLRSQYYVPSGMHVRDVMMSKEEIPMIGEDSSFAHMLNTIDEYAVGFTTVADNKGKFAGIISNADVRKGLIRKINDLNSIEVKDIVNKNPIRVYDDFSITEMIEFIKNTKQNILYLPVVDRKNNLTGAITFSNLIKGE